MSAGQATPTTSDADESQRVAAMVWQDLEATLQMTDRPWSRAQLGVCGPARLPGSHIKLVRGPGAVNAARTTLEIGTAAGREAAEAGAVLAMAHEFQPDIARLVYALAERPHWHLLAARDAGKVVAAAALFVIDASGYLFAAGTLPSHRRRGAHAALIERRLRIGFALGCTRLFCEAGADDSGCLRPPFANLARAGFRPFAVCESR
jgi:hypothetical protein